MCKDLRPYSVVEIEGFCHMLKTLEPNISCYHINIYAQYIAVYRFAILSYREEPGDSLVSNTGTDIR